MTWQDWINSLYNTDGISIGGDMLTAAVATNGKGIKDTNNQCNLTISNQIVENFAYISGCTVGPPKD